MEFYPTPAVNGTNPGVVMMQGNQCCAPQQSCGCCQTKSDRKNVISCETIAVHTITNIILWSFAALVIGSTPGVMNNVAQNQDGQFQGE